jgi:hypothetical protein
MRRKEALAARSTRSFANPPNSRPAVGGFFRARTQQSVRRAFAAIEPMTRRCRSETDRSGGDHWVVEALLPGI